MTFKDHKYSEKQIRALRTNAVKDLARAKKYSEIDVVFRLAYDAFLKLAIAICASRGIRVLARMGHHNELITEMSRILKNGKINTIGNKMRKMRNRDMYGGGVVLSKKEADEFTGFVNEIFIQADDYFGKKYGKVKLL